MKTKWTKRLLGGALVGAVSLFLGLQAHAAGYTPAGTEIRNQSVATYKDAKDQPQISTSNEVINIVAPLYYLEITPNYDSGAGSDTSYKPHLSYDTTNPALKQSTAPGNVAYYHYYLKNTGNTPDTYDLDVTYDTSASAAPSKIEVYYDANGNGQVDAGDTLLCKKEGANPSAVVAATKIVPQDATIPLIVAVHVPTNAATGNVIKTDINATSKGDNTKKDAITNWNQTTISSGTGILTATKAANVSSTEPGKTLTYTIEGSNTGSAPVYAMAYKADGSTTKVDWTGDGTHDDCTGILIIDDLDVAKLVPGTTGEPATYKGITVVAGSIAPTTAKVVYWNQGTSTWTTEIDEATWTDNPQIGLFIPDATVTNLTKEPVLTAGQGYKFSFEIQV